MTRRKILITKRAILKTLESPRVGVGLSELACQGEMNSVLMCWGQTMGFATNNKYEPGRCAKQERELRQCEKKMHSGLERKFKADMKRSLIFQMLRFCNLPGGRR